MIQSIHWIDDDELKAKIMHNLGYAYHLLDEYEEALSYYEQALSLKKTKSTLYLNTLNSYIIAAANVKSLSETDLVENIERGANLAKQLGSEYYTKLFDYYRIKFCHSPEVCISYLENELLPFFNNNSLNNSSIYFKKVLFHLYMDEKNDKDALELATTLL
ncbi:MAG: tetratricopeptide repeat protein [Bacilli bacterium]